MSVQQFYMMEKGKCETTLKNNVMEENKEWTKMTKKRRMYIIN